MTPEREAHWRTWAEESDLAAALSMPNASILILIEGLRELLEALDAERARVAKLERVAEEVRVGHDGKHHGLPPSIRCPLCLAIADLEASE